MNNADIRNSKALQNDLVARSLAGDELAKTELFDALTPIVLRVIEGVGVNSYQDWEDLKAEAFLGMVEALELYDPKFNARFSTYAFYRMRKNVSQWLARNSGTLPMPYEAWRTAKSVDVLEEKHKRELTAAELADLTGKGYAREAADARQRYLQLELHLDVMGEGGINDISLDDLIIELVSETSELSFYHAEYVIKEFVKEYELDAEIAPRIHKAAMEAAHENSDRPRSNDGRGVADRRRITEPRNRRG